MNKVEHLRWVLERQLHWIAAADQKLAILTPISLVLLGTLVATDRLPTEGISSTTFLFWMALLLAAASVSFSFSTLVSRTRGPSGSRLFFGGVASFTDEGYRSAFKAETEESTVQDLLGQIHINATIACTKHRAIKWAIYTLAGAVPFWGAFFLVTP